MSTEENPTPEVEVKDLENTATPVSGRQQVIERLQEIAKDASNVTRQELDQLKQSFYRLYKIQQESDYAKYIAEGGVPEEFKPSVDNLEEPFKKLMNIIKENRAAAQEALDAFRQENCKRKEEILEKMKAIIESIGTESASNAGSFKELVQEWKEIKEVPADKVGELWKSFQQYTEQFYDLQKLNSEFREYDFKKNLEAKVQLCQQAEALAEEEDVVNAFHTLQKLHQEFREIGPVAKESREEIWNRFKAASTVVNKRHQQYFEDQKKAEQEALDQKIVICEIVEGIDCTQITKLQQWNDKAQEIMALQEKWKSIGHTAQKQNAKVYERFRAACDAFFTKKSDFFKQAKDGMTENLKKKQELCQMAESLKDSTAWKETAEKIAQLQKEWKEIGPVAKKYSNALWDQFIGACNQFYENRDKTLHSQRSEESTNLKQKKEILSQLQAFDPENLSEDDQKTIKELMARWNQIGHVPYKLKDTIAQEYKKLQNALSQSSARRQQRRQAPGARIQRDGATPRERLQRQYENLKSEIQTYENNLGFLSASSKSGNSLVTSIIEKIDSLKAQAQEMLQQIKELDAPKED